MRRFVVVLSLSLLLGVAAAAEKTDVWSGLAGMTTELEAEALELRDEVISAHLGYMAALDAALGEIEAMPAGDARLAPAWARVEYLLETSFRLLDSTGEHEAFLKATARLKPSPAAPAEPMRLDEAGDIPADADGGLIYEDSADNRLVPALIDGRMALVDAKTAEPIASDEGVSARPAEEGKQLEVYVPLIRARAAWLRALTLERQGKTREAGEEASELGLIRDWLVLGPLDPDAMTYSEIAMNLEEVFDVITEDDEFPGVSGPVQWRPHVSVDPLGRLFPGALFRSEGMKSAYALALVFSDENREAAIRFGSNAVVSASVNHIQSGRDHVSGFSDPDQSAFNVWLRRGWNVVLLKMVSDSDSPGWGVAARLTGLDGRPLPCRVVRPDAANVAAVLAEARKTAARSLLERYFLPARITDTGGVTILSRLLLDGEDDARANFYLASLLTARRMMEGPDRFDRELIFRRAADLSGDNPFFTLMAARSVEAGVEGPEREENLRLVLLRAAADKGSAAALADIGRLYLDVMRQPRRADAYAGDALAANPMSLRAGILDYDVAIAMDWRPVALEYLGKLVKLHPSSAAARLRLGRTALERGRYRQALSEFHAVLAIDARNAEAIEGAVMALGMLGQTSAAVELLEKHMESFPYDSEVRLALAGLHRTLGRDDEALKVLDAALAMAPDDAEAQAMRMDIARETYAEGKKDDPAAHRRLFRQELDMSPPGRAVPGGWEYLYFQIEDRVERSGHITRLVGFALRIYTDRAAKNLRHLAFSLDPGLERGMVTRLAIVFPDGRREALTPGPQLGGADRTLSFNLPPLQIGMLVEAEVEIHRRRVPFLGDYFGQIAPMTQPAPTRLSRYMFTAPKDARVFFRPVNGAPEAMVAESADGQEVTRVWEMTNLPAFVPEPGSPGQNALMPSVQISSFADWNEFARWYWRLFGGQYHTPPELRRLAHTVAAGERISMAKLDRAAEWVSRNLGHREWEFGPYAFRPINARTILSRLSADGKDRALLLCLLAREYGLTAWPVLARLRDSRFPPAGSDDLSLPLLEHFNHSLTLVKTKVGGDVFLDASNPNRPPGVMPSQLFGSPGMAITPDSAEPVTIADGGASACLWEETADMTVDEDGSVLWEQRIEGTGTAAETLRMRFRDPDRRNSAWTAFLGTVGADPSAAAAEFDDDEDDPASSSFSGRARLRRFASVDNGRVVLAVPPLPGALTADGGQPYPLSLEDIAMTGEREQELVLPHGFRISRRIRVVHPPEWRLVNRLAPFRFERDFGWMELKASAADGVVEYEFTVEIPDHVLDAEDFVAFRSMAAQLGRWSRPLLVWETQ